MPCNLLKNLDQNDLAACMVLLASYPELNWSASSLHTTFALATTRAFGLCTETGSLLAMAVFMQVADEAELLLIATAKHELRQGYGRMLLTQALQALKQKGVKRIFLEVRLGNHAAQRLYTTAGFHLFHRRERYYQDGEAALLWQRGLDQES